MKRKPGHVSLERALSKLGVASRTRAREWILEGQIKVNGVIRRDPRFCVFPERAKIEVNGMQAAGARFRAFVLNKPKGYVTTHSDEKGRPTVFSLIQNEGLHLISVGRLDLATTGLLILTNDNQFAAWLTDPANAIERTYLVTVRGEIKAQELSAMEKGVRDEGELLQASKAVLRKASGKESHLVITLTAGKNREIRRLCQAFGREVTRLKRVTFGGLDLGDLESGKFKEVPADELSRAFPGAPKLDRSR